MPHPQPTYHMPAEWEPHAGTWLAWPHRKSDWPGKFAVVTWIYGEIVRVLSRYETVNVVVRDSMMKARVAAILDKVHADVKNVRLFVAATDRSWVRDSGPIFVRSSGGRKVALDWRFSAWAKYPDWRVDDKLPRQVAKTVKVPTVQPILRGRRIVLEGGGIDVDGAGTLLTTEEWLLSETQIRNPGMTRADYEAAFAEYLGIRKVIWLGRGIVGDDTHGHVDDLTRFTAERVVVTMEEKNESDENHAILRENLERLRGTDDARGRALEVVPLPMPAPLLFRGQRLPASYANFYIANGVVLVPTFNDVHDRRVLGALAELFPGRDVIGINSTDLVWGLGTLHCLSQQEPA
jgi:agmatine deiminase